jgi:hypothetical protein
VRQHPDQVGLELVGPAQLAVGLRERVGAGGQLRVAPGQLVVETADLDDEGAEDDGGDDEAGQASPYQRPLSGARRTG